VLIAQTTRSTASCRCRTGWCGWWG
jgi:hypothetical protein